MCTSTSTIIPTSDQHEPVVTVSLNQNGNYHGVSFSLDTAYMYILALILMLKIYQTRHPDINASAHSAYMVMAVVILSGVIGVVGDCSQVTLHVWSGEKAP